MCTQQRKFTETGDVLVYGVGDSKGNLVKALVGALDHGVSPCPEPAVVDCYILNTYSSAVAFSRKYRVEIPDEKWQEDNAGISRPDSIHVMRVGFVDGSEVGIYVFRSKKPFKAITRRYDTR